MDNDSPKGKRLVVATGSAKVEYPRVGRGTSFVTKSMLVASITVGNASTVPE